MSLYDRFGMFGFLFDSNENIIVYTFEQNRLSAWDEVSEQLSLKKQREEELRKRQLEDGNPQPPKKKRGRLGPETWKLRGAARPAHEVYGKANSC